MMNLKVSLLGLSIVFLFFILSFLGRVFFPVGDEPDISVRTVQLLNASQWLIPYRLQESLLFSVVWDDACSLVATPYSFWSKINSVECMDSLSNIFNRVVIVFSLLTPLFVLIVFRVKRSLRLDVISLSLVFPGMIYYLGLFSHEQLTLVFSLCIFVFWKFRFVVLLFLFFIGLVDVGNLLVVSFFVFSSWCYLYMSKKYRIKTVVLVMFLPVLIAFFYGNKVLDFLSGLSFMSSRVQAIINSLAIGDFREKYPLVFRPVLTYMNFVFMTPSFVKVPLAYVFVGAMFLWGGVKVFAFSSLKLNDDAKVLFANALVTILFFVFMLPSYGNAKYYIFLLPFIMMPFVVDFGRNKVFIFILFSNALVFYNLFLYYI